MAEEARAVLLQLPVEGVRGPHSRELAVSETGTHAHDGVVKRVAAHPEEGHQAAAEERWEGAPRLAGDEDGAALSDRRQQLAQTAVLEVMEEEIGQDHVPARGKLLLSRGSSPFEYVHGERAQGPAQVSKTNTCFLGEERLSVELRQLDRAPRMGEAPRDA